MNLGALYRIRPSAADVQSLVNDDSPANVDRILGSIKKALRTERDSGQAATGSAQSPNYGSAGGTYNNPQPTGITHSVGVSAPMPITASPAQQYAAQSGGHSAGAQAVPAAPAMAALGGTTLSEADFRALIEST